ncbi:MAG: response regulator transcription factor [Chitinophagales bacterium]|nr:response regulator transcription factor [Chitinophagales bacterium]
MITIAIADDNSIARRAIVEKLSTYTDLHIILVANNGKELFEMMQSHTAVDLILMDIEMPVMNGVQATEKIKQQFPNVKIIMVTVFADEQHIFDTIKAGADSYILKEAKAEKMYEAIHDTLNGGAVMSPAIAIKAINLLKNSSSSTNHQIEETVVLTERELEILNRISEGYSNKKIAEQLFISAFTVKRHIENIYQKLQTHNRIELLNKARKGGLI